MRYFGHTSTPQFHFSINITLFIGLLIVLTTIQFLKMFIYRKTCKQIGKNLINNDLAIARQLSEDNHGVFLTMNTLHVQNIAYFLIRAKPSKISWQLPKKFQQTT
jgi:hypothetical protein